MLVVLQLAVLVLAALGLRWLYEQFKKRSDDAPRKGKFRTCPRCTAPLRWGDTSCDVCLWPNAQDHQPRPRRVYEALHRALYRFHTLGLLSDETYQELLQTLQSRLTPQQEEASKRSLPLKARQDDQPGDTQQPLAEEHPERKSPPIASSPKVPESALPAAMSRETPEAPPQPLPEEVASRVAGYAASREAASAQAAQTPPTPPKPRRDWGKVFQAFMEQNNILWGELVGGLMIVGCSIALVISFWAQIAERPLLKYGIFNGLSAALFAAGFYTDRRWKIHTTSQGVLITAVLLVPLNFLAIAAFTADSPPTDLLSLAAEGASLAIFATLTFYAARVLTPQSPWGTTAGVMGASVMLLLVRRFAVPGVSLPTVLSLAAAPLAIYAGASMHSLTRTIGDKPLYVRPAVRHMILLGLCLFAVLLPLALLVQIMGEPLTTIQQLSFLLVVLAMPPLATGVTLWLRLPNEANSTRISAASVGAFGSLVLLASAAFAWPLPWAMLATALMNAVVWAVLARATGTPPLHVVAAACAVAAWLVASAVWTGDAAWATADAKSMLGSLLSAACGVRLTPAALVLGGLAIFARKKSKNLAIAWSQAAAGTAIVSIAMLLLFGFGRAADPHGVIWYLAFYAAAATSAAVLRKERPLAEVAAGLLLTAIAQAIVFRFGQGWNDLWSWCAALLGYATIACAIAAAAVIKQSGSTQRLYRVFNTAALIASAFVLAMLLGAGWQLTYNQLSTFFLWLSLVWLALAWLRGVPSLFIAYQLAFAAWLCIFVTGRLSQHEWYSESTAPWIDPWFLQAQGITIGLLAIFWRLARMAIDRLAPESTTHGADLRRLPWTVFDRGAGIGLFVLMLGMATYAVLPGMAVELSPSVETATRVPTPIAAFELPGIASSHAAGPGAWALLGVAATLVVMGCWDSFPSLRGFGLYLLGVAGCLLAGASFAEETSAASATRWLLGGFTLIAAAIVVARQSMRARIASLGIQLDRLPQALGCQLSPAARACVVGTPLLLYATIAALVAYSSLRPSGMPPGASVMLWWCSGLALVAAIAWLAFGNLATAPNRTDSSADLISWGHNLLGLIGAAPLVVAVAFVTATCLSQRPLVGPDPDGWFGGLANSLLYGGPLAMFALVLLAFSVRELSSVYAFSFGLLSCLVATLVYMLELAAAGGTLDAAAWIAVAQLNAGVAGVVALGWWALRTWVSGIAGTTDESPILLKVLAALGIAFIGETILAGCWGVFAQPASISWQASVASPGGFLAGIAAAIATWVTTKPTSSALALGKHHLGGALVLAIGFTTALAARHDSSNWLAYHTMLATCMAAGWGIALAPHRLRDVGWIGAFALLAAILAIRAPFTPTSPPGWPWWTIAGLLSSYGLSLRWARSADVRWPVWVGAPLFLVAANLWWWEATSLSKLTSQITELINLNLTFLSVTAIASTLVEVLGPGADKSTDPTRRRMIGFHRFAVWLGVVWLLLAVGMDLFGGQPLGGTGNLRVLGYTALGGLLIAAAATLWDPRIRWPVAAFYSLGLAVVGRYLASLQLQGDSFVWALTLALAAFALATSYLWNRRDAMVDTLIRAGAPAHLRGKLNAQAWMILANGIVIASVIGLAWVIEFSHAQFDQRMTAAYGVLAGALSLALMAQGRVETVLRYAALAVGAAFAVAFAWAWVAPDSPAAGLHRLATSGVATTAVIPIYGMLLVKLVRRANPWTRAAQLTLPYLAGLAGVLLLATLGIEVAYFVDAQAVPLRWPAVLGVALALAGLIAGSLAAALLPGRDPLKLSERGRTAYVYAAEVLIAMLLVHLRTTMPWLFAGWFVKVWPFVVMLIAFAGVGLSEWFARRKNRVMSEPLANTGVLLPLLPVVGYWITAEPGRYALLLVAVGALYSSLCVLRKSTLFAALAALAFNGSLWTMLHSTDGLGLLRHPQFWLIPPAACALIGAQLNRARMTAAQLTTVRYATAVMIYAASTADIFINGVGTGVWMPMVLAGLAIAGVMLGIVLRVRAFLFLGVGFLAVALLTVIWHAAVELERTWVWWVAGILTGLAIIILFGLFEKKRDEAQALIEKLKHWDA